MAAKKRLVVSFDGTWNAPNDDGDIGGRAVTNASRFNAAVRPIATADNLTQVTHYEPGVGVRWYNRFTGGIFGVGLSAILRHGYRFLVDNYNEGDEIFIFGFSRGAYTARSLAGMIRNVGLLRREFYRRQISDAESIYRSRDDGPDEPSAQMFRQRYARTIDRIECLGIWDTVGALGIPLNSFDAFNRRFYEFHDTRLSGIVRRGYQALAVDEHRESYRATLWNPSRRPEQEIEQVWFVGAHANVGGGYAESNLSDGPLLWMAEKAQAAGLDLDPTKLPEPPNILNEPLVDSFSRFLKGTYARFSSRYYRPLGATAFGQESLHPTVLDRLHDRRTYTPPNPTGPVLGGVPVPYPPTLREFRELPQAPR